MKAADLLDINLNMFRQMMELAQKQEKLLAEGLMDEYLSLANKREHLKNEISANERRYRTLIKGEKENSTKTKPMAEKISELIRSIQKLDKKMEKLLLEEKNVLMTDFSRMKKGRNALKNYRVKGNNSPRFIEKKG